MALLSSFTIPHASNKVDLIKNRRSKASTITILMGENGTRKSLILRQILEAALALIEPKQLKDAHKRTPDGGATFSEPPALVVAISAVPTDRFPAKPQPGEVMITNKFDTLAYKYLGPRTARNIISRNQSIYEFGLALLGGGDRLHEKTKFIRYLARKTSIPAYITMGLNIQPAFRRLHTGQLVDAIINGNSGGISRPTRISSWLKERLGDPMVMQHLLRLEEGILTLPQRKSAVLPSSKAAPDFPVCVDFANGGMDPGSIGADALFWGLTSGVLKVARLSFINTNRSDLEPVAVNAPSAGQWALFSSLASLALVAQDSTLILVDEPENTLHPRWQRDYMEDLRSAISGRKNCHVVLATHSPLIAASIKRTTDELIRLSVFEDDCLAESIEVPEGWASNDVLEDIFRLPSTRSRELEGLLDGALNIIASGIAGKEGELDEIKSRISRFEEILPEGDVARNLIDIIKRVPSSQSS